LLLRQEATTGVFVGAKKWFQSSLLVSVFLGTLNVGTASTSQGSFTLSTRLEGRAAMRVSSLLYASTVIALVGLSPVAWVAEQQTEPFHKHHDIRHGHDHYYPDRGAIVRDLPVGTIGTSYAGVSYRYHDGIWLEPRGPAYMVVAPPIGLVAPTLPLYSTVVTHGPDSFLYCNDTYYKPRPDLGGYEVVNDPSMESATAAAAPAPDALVGGQMPAAAGVVATTGGGTMTLPPSAASTVVPAAMVIPGAGAVSTASGAVVPAVAREASVGAVVPAASATSVVREASLAGGAMPGGGAVGASTAAAVPASAAVVAATNGTQRMPKVFLYPKNGQSAEQQARDRYDCYRFAVAQSGFDPMRTTAAAPTPTSEQQSDFDRAQGACFEGHGYSNR
jgi:hypothetical protein